MAAEASLSITGGRGGGGSEKIDQRLEDALIRFQCDEERNTASLYLDYVRFNSATVSRLTDFLCSGVIKNRHELCIDNCTFENNESLRLLCDFFDSNKSPKTLQKVELSSLWDRHVYECLLSSLHNTKTLTELSLSFDRDDAIQGRIGGEMVGNFLQQNTTLTALTSKGCRCINVEFIRAMRKGLLASRIRLKFLKLQDVAMGNEALNELRLVYANMNGKRREIYKTVLSDLDLSYNDFEGSVGGNHLCRLLLTLPWLTKLDISFNKDLRPEGARALFSRGIAIVLGRLQSLCITGCLIGNAGLAQMAASMPPYSVVPAPALVHLDLKRNGIWGDRGGRVLFRVLRRCPRLQTLHLNGNNQLGPEGVRAMAPALRNLDALQELDLVSIQELDLVSIFGMRERATEGAMAILPSLGHIRCLKSLTLMYNVLPPATLAPLIDFLNGTGRSLEVLDLYANRDLFGTANLDQHGRFFDTIANHAAMVRLDVRQYGQGFDETDGPLQSAVFKNRSLVTVNGKTAEYMRRNMWMVHIQATMTFPSIIPLAVWPMALGVCTPSPRIHKVAARPIFCLIQKMAEGDVFVHTAAVYRFEKVRAFIQVQRWWRLRQRFQVQPSI